MRKTELRSCLACCLLLFMTMNIQCSKDDPAPVGCTLTFDGTSHSFPVSACAADNSERGNHQLGDKK